MQYAIRAWRKPPVYHGTADGCGVVIGTVTTWGYDNLVAEIVLGDGDIDEFLAALTAARERAREDGDEMEEPMPDAYDRAWYA